MKTLIISLNSKYIHSSLAPWYLKASCGTECGEVIVSEHTINENPDSILSLIYSHRPDVVAFSCYIWNISHVLRLASSLKKLLPQTVIILGGPEVSYDAEDILGRYDFADFVIAGEGDRSFAQLIRLLHDVFVIKGNENGSMSVNEKMSAIEEAPENEKLSGYVRLSGNEWLSEDLAYTAGTGIAANIPFTADADFAARAAEIDGLAFRSGSGIIANKPAVIDDLDSLPSPYTDEMISSLKNKIVYFEASRGCPFSCSYCLSSVTSGTRYFSLERVFSELERLVRSGIRQIKFVDRTFNANPRRAKSIIRYLLKLNEDLASGQDVLCNFHFEVGADLFDEELIGLLADAPRGMFQLEAGVQSTNQETLAAVCRKTDLDRLFNNLRVIREKGNVHIHADLIAGLPFEDYRSFGRSFDDVYSIKPHQLQLGFLKFLKGTELRKQAEALGYVYRDYEPYEILAGKYISGDELMKLKGIAEIVERYYNSGRFSFTLDYVISRYFDSAFAFYESFYEYLNENGCWGTSLSVKDQYEVLDRFCRSITCVSEDAVRYDGFGENTDIPLYRELMRLDFLASDNTGTLPSFMQSRYSSEFREKCINFLRNSEQINRMIPETIGMPPKQMLKKVHFDRFFLNGLLPVSGDGSAEGDGSSSNPSYRLSAAGDSPAEGDGSSETSAHINPRVTTLMFNYFTRDKVTGRYQFFKIEI